MTESPKRPAIFRKDIAIIQEPMPGGHVVLIRRRKRVRQGLVMGPAQPRELDIVKDLYPDIAVAAGIMPASDGLAGLAEETVTVWVDSPEAPPEPKPAPKKRGRPKKAT